MLEIEREGERESGRQKDRHNSINRGCTDRDDEFNKILIFENMTQQAHQS